MNPDVPRSGPVTRRRFGVLAGGALVSFAFGGACQGSVQGEGSDGRITARPRPDLKTSGTGSIRLELGAERDGVLQLPSNPTTDPLPLLVLLHGAGGSGAGILRRLGGAAGAAGIAVLAPDSRGSSWDAIRGDFGSDVRFINRALAHVCDRVAVDPARLSAGGFSDGATYALSLALINGDLFRRVVAFSPGFVVERTPRGRPRVFISHGTADTVLPIDRCSRVIVPRLQRRGYEVTFREFNGGHEVPADIARQGMEWARADA
jgi:phospholipase/carboxylesterase